MGADIINLDNACSIIKLPIRVRADDFVNQERLKRFTVILDYPNVKAQW